MFFNRLIDDVFLVLRDAHPKGNVKSVRSKINDEQLCNLIVKDPNDIVVLLTMKRVPLLLDHSCKSLGHPSSMAESGWSYLFDQNCD